ncbi:hypothetical protein, partial [Rhizobium sp. E27B/91]
DIITAHVLLLPTNHSGMESWQSVHSKGLFPHPAKFAIRSGSEAWPKSPATPRILSKDALPHSNPRSPAFLPAAISEVTFCCGQRPMTPDGTPVFGQTEIKGLFLNTGNLTIS